jgi:thiol-disulfide isomerase/thioredoxin
MTDKTEKNKKKDRIITVAISIVVVLLLAYNVFNYYGARITLPGTEMPSISGHDPVTNKAVAFDFSKGRVLVNFWATWCGACVKEMPYLNDISRKYRVVGVMKGPFVRENYPSSDVKFDNLLADESFFNNLNISVLPTSILVEDGIIKEVHVGMINKDVISDWFGTK